MLGALRMRFLPLAYKLHTWSHTVRHYLEAVGMKLILLATVGSFGG